MPVTNSVFSSTSQGTARRPRADGEPFFGKNPLFNVLDALSVGQFAAAGVTEEVFRRKEGRASRSFIKAAGKGISQKTSFSDVTGSVAVGLPLDILIDPLNLVPVAAATKLFKLAKIPKALKAVSKATDSVTAIRKFKEGVGSAVIPAFKLKKHNPDEILKLRNEHMNLVAGASVALGKRINKELSQLVPDVNIRETLFRLAEKEPVGEVAQDVAKVIDFNKTVERLLPNERKFFERSKEILKELEGLKIRTGDLTRERAQAFLDKFQIPYAPRIHYRRGYVEARLEELIESLEAGDSAVDATATIGDARAALKEIRGINEVMSDQGINMLRKFQSGELAELPSWAKRRTTTGQVVDLDRIIQKEINQDMAEVLGIQSADVAARVANVEYVRELTNFMLKKGLIFEEADKLGIAAQAIKKLPSGEAVGRLREGFSKIKNINRLPEPLQELLKDKVVPNSLAGEINGVIRNYTDPAFMKGFFEGYRKWQNIWKGWTLSIFPSYHSRNALSNLWNNQLAGMDVKEFAPNGSYWNASKVQWNASKNTLDNTKRLGFKKFNGTQQDLWRAAEDNRVIRAGEFAGELGDTIERGINIQNITGAVIDPARNKVLRKGFEVGTMVEDHARLSHFMWRLKKGDDVKTAAKSVQKFLFDYKYGLTEFETRVGRDFLVPFYAWTRFNVPLQLEMIINQPQKFTRVGKFKRAWEDQFGGPEPEERFLADWIKESTGVRLWYNKKTGNHEYFLMGGWWPASDINKAFPTKDTKEEIVNMLSPFPKLGVELVENYKLFQRRKLQRFKGEKERVLGIPLPVRMAHLVRQARVVNEAHNTIEAFKRAKGSGVPGFLVASVRPLFGRTYPQNMEKQRRSWLYVQRKQLGNLRGIRKFQEKSGETINIENLDKQIADLEQLIKENK